MSNLLLPARGHLVFRVQLAYRGAATWRLYDVSGRLVATRALGTLPVGITSVSFDVEKSLGSGMYWAALEAGEYRAVARVVLPR